MAGNLGGLHQREDAELAVDVMELLQDGNVRAKGDRTYHLVISFHPEDRRRTPMELEDVVRRAVRAAGLEEHQYIAVRHSEQEHEHLHVAVNPIHPETLKIHHPYKAIHAYQALASCDLRCRVHERSGVPYVVRGIHAVLRVDVVEGQ